MRGRLLGMEGGPAAGGHWAGIDLPRSGRPRPPGRVATPVFELSRPCPCPSWQLRPPSSLGARGGPGGGQLLGPQVSRGASARPGHFLCAL